MLVLRDLTAIKSVPDDEIRCLAVQRHSMLTEEFGEYDSEVSGYFIVLEDGDALDGLDKQLGFPILCNRYTGVKFGEGDFFPGFELVEEHANCFEMVFVLSDDGFGIELFIPKFARIDPELLAMCRRYAISAEKSRTP